MLGPNADRLNINGGGSASLNPHHRSELLPALRSRFTSDVELVHVAGVDIDTTTPPMRVPVTADVYAGTEWDGPVRATKSFASSELLFFGPVDDIGEEARTADSLSQFYNSILTRLKEALEAENVAIFASDEATGEFLRPRSHVMQLSDYVMGALDAGLRIVSLVERSPDEALAARVPRAAKYVAWPMLLVMTLERA